MGINSPNANAIPGQSGSSLFYTDNNEYYTFGVLNFSTAYRHYQINQDVFYQLKNILDNYSLSISEVSNLDNTFKLFPNPLTFESTIITNKILKEATLEIYNLAGQKIKSIKNISGNTITLHRDNLTNGIYFIRITQVNKIFASEKLLITD